MQTLQKTCKILGRFFSNVTENVVFEALLNVPRIEQVSAT